MLGGISEGRASGPAPSGRVSVGVDYCTVHDGIRNEDDHRCDMAKDDLDLMRWKTIAKTADGEPRPCVLHELSYAAPDETAMLIKPDHEVVDPDHLVTLDGVEEGYPQWRFECTHEMDQHWAGSDEEGNQLPVGECWLETWWDGCGDALLNLKGPLLGVAVKPSGDWGESGGRIVLDMDANHITKPDEPVPVSEFDEPHKYVEAS